MPSSSSNTPYDDPRPQSPSSSLANNGHGHHSSPATPSSSSLKIKLSKRPRPEDAAPSPSSYASQVDQPGPSRLSPQPPPPPLARNGNGHHDYAATPASPAPSSSAAEWTPPIVPTPPWPAHKKKRVAQPVDIHEGLTKLIQTFVKKDAYGFFHAPVDEAEVPGYRTVIRNPMDLGTMETKVEHNQYADVASFRDDFLLVTNNAKLFNPPGSIYHTQAQKLEDYGVKAIQRLEDRGVRQRDEESSPDPLDGDLSQTYENSYSYDAADDVGGDSRPKKPKLKGRASTGSQRGGKKATKAARSKTSSRASSRPLVPSSLSKPPMTAGRTLADSPSPASGSDDGGGHSDEEDDDGDESMQDATSRYPDIKREDGEGSDEDVDDDDDDDDDERGSTHHRRGSTAARNSQTPMPGGAPRRKMMPIRGRNFPPRRQPLTFAESPAAAIDKVLSESTSKSVDIDLGEAALRHRAETRKQDFKPTAFMPDGSLDLESLRFSERNDLLAPQGIVMDPATGLKPMYLCDSTVPELSSTHPLHPDAQRHQAQLVRPAPYDALRLTTSERALPKEATGSHYEHGMPATQQRLPMFLPTASVTPATAAAAAASASSRGNDQAGASSSSSSSSKRVNLGSVSSNLNPIPHRWPHPLWSTMPEYEPHPHLDPLYPPPEPEDPAAAKSKHWRSKDFEREQYGFATLGDWTYPHAHYTRVWDGAGDLAVWKDVEGATIGAAPVDPTVLASSGVTGAPPPSSSTGQAQPLAPGALYGLDGQLGHYERWDWARLTVLRDTLMWEDREATCRAVGVNAPDKSTERALLEKLMGMDEAANEAGIGQGDARRGSEGSNGAGGQGGASSSSSTLRATAPAVPAHERASQADSSGRFLQSNVWGGFEAELWASSIERFVKGAVAGVVEDVDDQSDGGDEASARPAIKMDVDEGEGKVKAEPQETDVAPPSSTREERVLEAIRNDVILDRDLYKWVRDELVVPVTKNRYGAVIARTGELIEELELRQRGKGKASADEDSGEGGAANGDDNGDAASNPERILTASNVSYLVAHMPLIWARLRLVRLLLDRPMSLVNPDDAPPFILRDKEAEWGRQPPMLTSEGAEAAATTTTTRYADDEWTAQRVKECLGEYASLLMELDARIREKRRNAGAADGAGTAKVEEGAEQQQDVDDAATRRVKEELRLALLALARFAPSNQIRA